MDFSNSIDRDYSKYKEFVRYRKFLFEDERFIGLDSIYKKLYTISELLSQLDEIDEKSMIENFSRELKNTLTISFDLLNMNYLNSSKQTLRSSIESFFRLSLSISRYNEYQINILNGCYSSTESLKNLKSLYTSHGVYKLTSGTIRYFESTNILECLQVLNDCYTCLSGNVHVNSISNFSPQRFLEDYSNYDDKAIIDYINFYLTVINCIAISLIYLLKFLNIDVIKKQIQIIEMGLEDNMITVLNEILQ